MYLVESFQRYVYRNIAEMYVGVLFLNNKKFRLLNDEFYE